MWTPLDQTKEEGWIDPLVDLPSPDHNGVPQLDGLTPRDYLILGKVFEGKKPPQIAREIGVEAQTIRKRIELAEFQRLIRRTEEAILERVARGEFGALAIAKAEQVGAIRRLVGLSRSSSDERVMFQANCKILELSGFRAPAQVESAPPERIIDQFTAEEAQHFAETGEWPQRFADQVARLASSVLQDRERRRWAPQIEGPAVGSEDRAPAREELEEE